MPKRMRLMIQVCQKNKEKSMRRYVQKDRTLQIYLDAECTLDVR